MQSEGGRNKGGTKASLLCLHSSGEMAVASHEDSQSSCNLLTLLLISKRKDRTNGSIATCSQPVLAYAPTYRAPVQHPPP